MIQYISPLSISVDTEGRCIVELKPGVKVDYGFPLKVDYWYNRTEYKYIRQYPIWLLFPNRNDTFLIFSNQCNTPAAGVLFIKQ
jgi:hypothetical protein